MSTNEKKEGMTLTLVEAVETLSNIADLEFDRETGIADEHEVYLHDRPLSYHTVHWLHHQDAQETVTIVKDIFRVILKYLKGFYSHEYNKVTDTNAVERIKTIMVLVGEAARKLDRYTALFYKNRPPSVTELREYKQLQEFYVNRIARKIDEGTLGKWILALSSNRDLESSVKLVAPRTEHTRHVFIDLESAKKDSEYELFFLRKEDGTRFFSPRLLRNIKLISDFGNLSRGEDVSERTIDIHAALDKTSHAYAASILRSVRNYVEKFYKVAMQNREKEIVSELNKAVLALMMAANPHSLEHRTVLQGEAKDCISYFRDFQVYLRNTLNSIEYQKMLAYPPGKSSKAAHATLQLVQFICMALFTQLWPGHEITGFVAALVQKSMENTSEEHKKKASEGGSLWKGLAGEYASVGKFLKGQTASPINKLLDMLEHGDYRSFDPLMQDNLPTQLYNLYVQERKIQFARWPSPTVQEYIHKVAVNEEFKAFLYASSHEHIVSTSLVFNFQDRLSWKEHFRAVALEGLAKRESFAKHIEVVTLPKDTEFYHQISPYNSDNSADVFISNFKEQLKDEACGVLIPSGLKNSLMIEFAAQAIDGIHRVFFSGKNVLTREQRADFIEIFYLFMQLKIIERVKPDIVGFSCKDGLDVSISSAVSLFAMLKLCNQERLSEMDREHIDGMIYSPCLFNRERLMLPERFSRMIGAIRTIESVRDQLGFQPFVQLIHEAFGHLYKTDILKGKVVVQNTKDVF